MSRLKGKAFTLIELLVVIAIISLLSSVVLASLSAAREGARDAARLSDTKNVMTAIELYKNDTARTHLMAAITMDVGSVPVWRC